MRARGSVRWLLPLLCLSALSLGAGRCPREGELQSPLFKLLELLDRHERRIGELERCACCCEGILAPVCADSGKTFLNECEARCAGARLVARGPCRVHACGGPAGLPCGREAFCELPPGCRDPLAFGRCEERPEVCPRIFAPVCGCDGRTYGNDCERRGAGVPLDHEGPCEEPGRPCGTNADCEAREYCGREPGACREPGVCRPRPELCPDVFAPVCGCDGRTYGNACEAAAAGVSVAHDGACREEPRPCRSNEGCREGELCRKPDGACAEAGLCAARPVECPAILAPVCGCDGVTYENLCRAAAAGASLAHAGACREGPRECASNADCGPLDFCRREGFVCEGPGVCVRRPEACIQIFDPVCGCDGRTYGNACNAASAGVGVAHAGPCRE